MTFHQEGIYLVYTLTYDLPFHMTGIYTWYIYLTYDRLRHMSGIYQVYTMIITFQGFPDERLELLTLLDEASSHARPTALPVLLYTRQSFPRA